MIDILIADDEEMNCELLRARLELHGYRVEEAADGEEAFEKACAHSPAVVLLDIRMPRIDGMAVLRKLRAIPETAALPVIAVTAFAMNDDQERIHAAGFDGYVTKPVDMELLLKMLRDIVPAQR